MGGKVENALYLVNGGIYLHIADSGDRFDYTIYDKETMRQVYHGQLDVLTVCEHPAQGIFNAARYAVFEDYGINAVTVEEVPLDMLQKLKNIQLDPPLDEYPRPDYGCTMADIACMGYLKGDLLPVADDIAKDLSRQGFRIYEVDAHGTVQGPVDVNSSSHNLFAVSRAGWQNSRGFREAVADRMKHQTERELTFRCQSQDCFAIYQLHHHDPDLRYIRYESLESLQKQGQRPQRGNYELVYTAPLPEGTGLNTLWTKFNTDHPPDYQHPSMSVSDVIAVKRNGTITCYYVDQFGFAVLDNFLAQRPRQAELGKPSIKRQLAAKPVPGDHPAKPRDREARYDAATNSVYIDSDAPYQEQASQPIQAAASPSPAAVTEGSVQATLTGLRAKYPHGAVYPSPYTSTSNPPYGPTNKNCAGWAILCSDAAFGNLPWRKVDRPSWEQIRPGDLVEMRGGGLNHGVIVLKRTEECIEVTESGLNQKVMWGGQYFRWWLEDQPTYVLYTRYPA